MTNELVAVYVIPGTGMSRFWWRMKSEYTERILEVRLRWTDIQPSYNICSRGGRREWWTPRQPNSTRNTAREISQMITHAIINPIQQGLLLVNRREPMLPFGASRTPKGIEVALQSTTLCWDFDLPIKAEHRAFKYSFIFCSVSRLTFSLIFCGSNDNYNWKE